MSGLSRTPGKRVWDNIPTGVRIPPSPPRTLYRSAFRGAFLFPRRNPMIANQQFYHDLNALHSFDEAVETRLHTAIPSDWWIVVADVIGSTKAIASGDYKSVNTVGVACIAAVLNIDRSIDIPFVFGGDGATFAVPESFVERIKAALRGAQELAKAGFGLELRAGLVSVESLLSQGLEVNLAKIQLSPYQTLASFSGQGWDEAERQVKGTSSGNVTMINESLGQGDASFEGFECRWKSVPNFHGHKLSLLVSARSTCPQKCLQTYQSVADQIRLIYGEVESYHPLRSGLMELALSPNALAHEWKVRAAKCCFLKRIHYFGKIALLNLAGKFLLKQKIVTEKMDWSNYRNELVANTDFRKFDGMLKMVIDGNEEQAIKLESYLESHFLAGDLFFGTFKSNEALVTCLVQSYNGNHLHFVDGSDGGYALAAEKLKRQKQRHLTKPAPQSLPAVQVD